MSTSVVFPDSYAPHTQQVTAQDEHYSPCPVLLGCFHRNVDSLVVVIDGNTVSFSSFKTSLQPVDIAVNVNLMSSVLKRQ